MQESEKKKLAVEIERIVMLRVTCDKSETKRLIAELGAEQTIENIGNCLDLVIGKLRELVPDYEKIASLEYEGKCKERNVKGFPAFELEKYSKINK